MLCLMALAAAGLLLLVGNEPLSRPFRVPDLRAKTKLCPLIDGYSWKPSSCEWNNKRSQFQGECWDLFNQSRVWHKLCNSEPKWVKVAAKGSTLQVAWPLGAGLRAVVAMNRPSIPQHPPDVPWCWERKERKQCPCLRLAGKSSNWYIGVFTAVMGPVLQRKWRGKLAANSFKMWWPACFYSEHVCLQGRLQR